MCGILSVIDYEAPAIDEALLSRMRDTMYHRGPNDAGLHIDGQVGLAHRRLSIIDLSETGHQPMFNEDKTLALVCNGEIYNYVELKEALEKRGHRFRSTSDSEVILHQYEENGEACLEKFNGMFAFAIWDAKRRRLFAARDRLGIKPLYYYRDDRQLILASEIKAIIEDPRVRREPDYRAIADYLFAGRPLAGRTLFKGVKEVEPGFMLTFDKKSRDLRLNRYWDIDFEYDHSRSLDQVRHRTFELLDDAVRVHCRSDAPLGCHLSGGLDSSTVAAFTSRHLKGLEAFSIKFSRDAHIDETGFAKAVASHLGFKYVEGAPPDANIAELLPHLIWQMDLPMISDGAIGYYYVNKVAAGHVKVTMTGHGGDEVFAGYPAQFYTAFNRTDMFQLFIDPERTQEQTSIKNRLLKGLFIKGTSGILRSIKNRLVKKEPTLEEIWILMHCACKPDENYSLSKEYVDALEGYSPIEDYIRPFREINAPETLDRCLYHDLKVYLPSLLHLEDRASMSHSLESRLPLLDYRLVEFLATVPPDQKVHGLTPKYLLRDAASSLIPPEVWKRRDKKPFPIPIGSWMSEEMHAMKKRLLLDPRSLNRGIFKHNALKDAVTDVDSWPVVNLEMWFRLFIDKDPYWLDLARSAPTDGSMPGRMTGSDSI